MSFDWSEEYWDHRDALMLRSSRTRRSSRSFVGRHTRNSTGRCKLGHWGRHFGVSDAPSVLTTARGPLWSMSSDWCWGDDRPLQGRVLSSSSEYDGKLPGEPGGYHCRRTLITVSRLARRKTCYLTHVWRRADLVGSRRRTR
jgi:hypothetical protein